MERNVEENFSMKWNIEWKIFSMEWKKIASMEYGNIRAKSTDRDKLTAKQ